jgi:hypothetical protein
VWQLMSPLLHQIHCPIENRTESGGHSDAAMRITETYTLHRLADLYGNMGKWIACRLDDGRSDNMLYDSKEHAIKFQKHYENYYTFIQMVPAQITPCEAEVMIKTARMFYNKGARNSDGFGRRELITRLTWEDQIAMSKGIVTNVQLEGNE